MDELSEGFVDACLIPRQDKEIISRKLGQMAIALQTMAYELQAMNKKIGDAQ